MRYYFDETTLFVTGSFRVASTSKPGKICAVSTMLLHSHRPLPSDRYLQKELESVAARAGIGSDFIGLLTLGSLPEFCILKYDFISVFLATVTIPTNNAPIVNIIVCSSENLTDAELLETIDIARQSKDEALIATGLSDGSPHEGIFVACERGSQLEPAKSLSETGKRIRAAILYGVPAALRRHEERGEKIRPAFYIFSRIKEEHWVEWFPETCPYYPCHFDGQRCDYCYCPFYPCGDETLGQWTESGSKGKVWNCASCTLLHEPDIADYLKCNPGASLRELIRRKKAHQITQKKE